MGQEIPPSSQDTRRGCGGMESEVGDVGVRRPEHCAPLSLSGKLTIILLSLPHPRSMRHGTPYAPAPTTRPEAKASSWSSIRPLYLSDREL